MELKWRNKYFGNCRITRYIERKQNKIVWIHHEDGGRDIIKYGTKNESKGGKNLWEDLEKHGKIK